MTTDRSSNPFSSAALRAPLVTFALFAYNQEKFIRQAVGGAFTQSYEPLEIILSDDCSTDRTFEIMQEMAAAYRGPHRVRAVQTPHNLGVVQHVLLRGREAAGDIVVLAAGDDISLPERVARHVPCYADAKVWAVSTGFSLIDDQNNPVDRSATNLSGRITKRVRPWDPTYLRAMPDGYTTIQGSTASYRKSAFDLVQSQRSMQCAEDQLFTFVIHAFGYGVAYLPHSFLQYRIHSNALSNQPPGSSTWRTDELQSLRAIDTEIEKLRFFLEFTELHGLEAIVDVAAIRLDLSDLADRKTWQARSVISRAISALNEMKEFRKLARGRIYPLAWKLARLSGKFPDYWPLRQVAGYRKKYRRR